MTAKRSTTKQAVTKRRTSPGLRLARRRDEILIESTFKIPPRWRPKPVLARLAKSLALTLEADGVRLQ